MIKHLLQKIFGTANDRYLKSLESIVSKINSIESLYTELTDEELKSHTQLYRTRIKQGESLDELLPEAFAVVREAAKRVLGQRHYDVQLMGGIALHKGMIAEMKTGEGKTLVATLSAYLNALEGKGVHVVSVNDYLIRRDSEWMGKVYAFLGMTTGCITQGCSEEDRKKAYNADITYATNNELGFDYLRDNMKHALEHCVQRPFNYAIIDEVDSILIDEARTPLVISGPSEDRSELYQVANMIIDKLHKDDFEIDEKSRQISLTDAGTNNVEAILVKEKLIKKDSSLFDIANVNILHHVNQGLKANHLFKNNVDYLVKDNQVMIIDEFTGRIMDGRRFSDGLHQALEAKEKVFVQNENQTLASITYQNYFRLYPKLSGMTGTATTEAAEFSDIYRLQVVAIPTKNPMIRKDEDDLIYRTAKEKYEAIIEEIIRAHERQQPILVGTVSIEKSELLSRLLTQKKIKHNILNAKHHEKEAHIIAQAGRPGTVTIATNMAGRGTDIMLGGNPEMLATESKSDVNSMREQVEKDKALALETGGLLVMGTERHESRRIDNQLRGRSGRMGDPGRSIFYLSLEDDLMRIFASDKISSILKTLGLKEGEAIFHPMISRTIEKAQQKVEARNYETRKNLLKFDDVMNEQRKIIYEQRHEVISSTDIQKTVTDIYTDLNQEIISLYLPENKFKAEWDINGLALRLDAIYGQNFGIQQYLASEEIKNEDVKEYLVSKIAERMQQKLQRFGEKLFETAEKRILLITLDQVWKDHLLSLDHLKHGIYLRSFAQKDPLNEYKKEAFEYFAAMLNTLRELFITRVMRMEIANDGDALSEIPESSQNMYESHGDAISQDKVGRNAPCPCNSKKKYKHCHGKLI